MERLTYPEETIKEYNKLKFSKNKAIVLYISDEFELKIAKVFSKSDFSHESFVSEFPRNEPRFGVLDLDFETDDHIKTYKLVMINWIPEGISSTARMKYISNSAFVMNKFDGIYVRLTANEEEDVSYENLVEKCKEKMY